MKAIRNFTRTDWALAITVILLGASLGGNIFLGIQLGGLQFAPPPINTLIFATTVGPEDIDPATCYDTGGSDVITQVCEGLYKFNLSDPDHSIVPVLATDLPTLQGNVLTIGLRENVTFHDGAIFNATSAKWSLDRLMHFLNYSGNDWLPAPWNVPISTEVGTTAIAALISGAGGIPLINETLVVDEFTLNITLNYPTGFLLPLFAYSGLYFVSPESTPLHEYIDPTATQSLVGTGPFKFDYYLGQIEVKLSAYEDYWQGAPQIDGVAMVIYSSQTTANDALLSGDVHLVDAVQTKKLPSLRAASDITVSNAGGSINTNYLMFNCDWINETWREAISFAIDYDYIIDVDMDGEGTRLRSPVPAGVLYSNYTLDTAELDLTTARQVMQSMGYGLGQDTSSANNAWWEAQTFRSLTITVQNDNDNRQDAAQSIKNSLESIGISVTVSEVEFSTLVTYLINPNQHSNMEMHIVGWSPDFIDPDNYLEYAFHSGSGLCQNYSNSEVDTLIENGQLELDPVARKAIYDRIQEILLEEDFPIAPLFTGISYDAYINRLYGWVGNNIGRVDFYPCYFV
jgi:peptide/nickel transport system substrate-binding protein